MMFMAQVSEPDRPRWWSERIQPCAAPSDFEATFVEIGRLACQEHYFVGRTTITSWLTQLGKDRLIQLRADHVRQLRARMLRRMPPDFEIAYVMQGPKECSRRYRCDHRTMKRWLAECGAERLQRLRQAQTRKEAVRDMRMILSHAFPVAGSPSKPK